MILAIIQARMSSTRLPGKMMLKINNKPLIEYVVNQARAIKNLDRVILATSTNQDNDQMSEYIRSLGLTVFRGSETDVLDRFYQAAKPYHPQHVVRITGDCPLIDPDLCSSLIIAYLKGSYDYACLSSDFAEGLDSEIFSYKTLKTAYKNAILQSEREHVTLYVHNHSSQFKKFILPNHQKESVYRITVDEKEDVQVVSNIISYLSKKYHPPFYFHQVKKYLDEHPETKKLNSAVIRNEGLIKSLRRDPKIRQ